MPASIALSPSTSTRSLAAFVDEHRPCAGQDSERWFASQVRDSTAERLCSGCPLTGIGGPCFELAVREDVDRIISSSKIAKTRKISAGSRIHLHGVRGGAKPGKRRPFVLKRLRDLGFTITSPRRRAS